MDMITEHNYGVPFLGYSSKINWRLLLLDFLSAKDQLNILRQIPLNKENDASHMEDIHTEMLKRLVIFLALPAFVLFSSIIWLTIDWPGLTKSVIENRRRKLRRRFNRVNTSFRPSVIGKKWHSAFVFSYQIYVGSTMISFPIILQGSAWLPSHLVVCRASHVPLHWQYIVTARRCHVSRWTSHCSKRHLPA